MPILTVGTTEIPYRVYRSHRAEKRRIEVKPEGIRLTVLPDDKEDDINKFIKRKKRWIYDQYDTMREKLAKRPNIHRYVSGAKIPYRGRMMMLNVERSNERDVSIHFRNRFHIQVPEWIGDEAHDYIVEDALRLWLRKRAREDAKLFYDQYKKQTGLKPKALRVRDQKHHWGLCGKDGTIHINWNLIFSPKPVMEYAVVHEMCHLRYRDHGEDFWGLVEAILPDYRERKHWLDKNEHMLSLSRKDFLVN